MDLQKVADNQLTAKVTPRLDMNRVLYIGVFTDSTSDRYRLNGMRQAGIDVLKYDYRQGLNDNPKQFVSEVVRQTRKFKPHMVFVNGGDILTPTMIARIKKAAQGAKWLLWDGNPRKKMRSCLTKLMPCYDAVLLPSDDPEENKKYKLHGAQKIFYYQQVVDHLTFKRMNVKPLYDVVFFGANYANGAANLFTHSERRRDFITRLIEECGGIIKIKIYGGGWGKYTNQPVFGRDFIKAASEAKIMLGFQNFNDLRYFTSTRTFLCMSCGFYLTDVWKGAHEIFKDGKHLKFFTTYEQMLKSINKYLENDKARNKIYSEGRRLIETTHNYRRRAEELKDISKELEN